MSNPEGLCLLGHGAIFETLVNDAPGHSLPSDWQMRRAESVGSLASSSHQLLEGLDPAATRLFIAIDQNALNHARLELYGAARLRGFRMASLIHVRAYVAPDAKLDDNVWIGAAAFVGSGSQVCSDVMVHPCVRIDRGARIGTHGWIGPGASVGADTEVGAHCVIGADAHLRGGLRLGRHCLIEGAGEWSSDMKSGSFSSHELGCCARIVGAGYTFDRPA